jgi:hypothetical protein
MNQLSLLEWRRLERPDVSDRQHAVEMAAELVDELDADPPVRLEMVASARGVVRIDYDDALDCPGCLVPAPGGLVIKLRKADAWGRRRFTGFHEVGHTFMPGYRQRQQRCDPGEGLPRGTAIEQLCDIAASELLFPRAHFTDDLEEAPFGMDTVERLAQRYEATLVATARRVVDLSPYDTLLIVLESRRKPSDRESERRRLRVAWSHARGAWPFVLRHKSVDDSDPLTEVLTGRAVDVRGDLRTLVREPVTGVEISARRVPYRGSSGETCERALALYRKLPERRIPTTLPQR